MAKAITIRKSRVISFDNKDSKKKQIEDVFLFLYFCTLNAHRAGTGFDQYFGWVAFVGFIGFFILRILFQKKDRYFYIGGFTAWYAIFCIYSYLSSFWAVYGTDYVDIYLAYFIKIFIFTFFLIWYIKDFNSVEKVVKMIYYSFIYLAIRLIIATPLDEWFSDRVGEVLYWNSCNIAFRMSLAVLFAFVMYKLSRQKRHLIIMCIFLFLSLASGARQGIFMPVVLISIFILYMSKNSTVFLKNIIIASLLCLIALFLVLNIPILYDFVGYRLEGFLNYITNSDGWVDASTIQRNQLKSFAWQMFYDSPIIGNGLNNFTGFMGNIRFEHVTYTHSNYLEILSGLGLIGFVIYYSMIVFVVIKLLSLVKQKNMIIAMYLAIVLTIIIFDYITVTYGDYLYIALYAIAYRSINLLKYNKDKTCID